MASGEELVQDTREQLDLARAPDELVVDHRAGVELVLDALEQERVLADLPELHELVATTLDTSRFAIADAVNFQRSLAMEVVVLTPSRPCRPRSS